MRVVLCAFQPPPPFSFLFSSTTHNSQLFRYLCAERPEGPGGARCKRGTALWRGTTGQASMQRAAAAPGGTCGASSFRSASPSWTGARRWPSRPGPPGMPPAVPTPFSSPSRCAGGWVVGSRTWAAPETWRYWLNLTWCTWFRNSPALRPGVHACVRVSLRDIEGGGWVGRERMVRALGVCLCVSVCVF